MVKGCIFTPPLEGNNTSTSYDPARPGTRVGLLEVEAGTQEPVSVLKARMIQAAREAGHINDDKDRYGRG